MIGFYHVKCQVRVKLNIHTGRIFDDILESQILYVSILELNRKPMIRSVHLNYIKSEINKQLKIPFL